MDIVIRPRRGVGRRAHTHAVLPTTTLAVVRQLSVQPVLHPSHSWTHARHDRRKRHYKGKTKRIGMVVAILAAALGLAGIFGVVHSLLAADDIGAAIWAGTCMLWAGFLAVMARQLGWEDPNSSSSSTAHRRRRYVQDAACCYRSCAAICLRACADRPGASHRASRATHRP